MANVDERNVVESVKAQIHLSLDDKKVKSISVSPVNPAVDPLEFEDLGRAVAGLCMFPFKDVARIETTTFGNEA